MFGRKKLLEALRVERERLHIKNLYIKELQWSVEELKNELREANVNFLPDEQLITNVEVRLTERIAVLEEERDEARQALEEKDKALGFWQQQPGRIREKIQRLEQANAALLVELDKHTKLLHSIQLYMGQDVWNDFCAQYDTAQPTAQDNQHECPKCGSDLDFYKGMAECPNDGCSYRVPYQEPSDTAQPPTED